ncbi:MAG: DNA-processing protein DprA [Ignavibacteria bacterium]|nr:DNA-processing protein DprA [Ignavibacteria bacterium]
MAENLDLSAQELNETKYLHFLSGIEGIGNIKIYSLLKLFKSAEAVFNAGLLELKNTGLLSVNNLKNFDKARKSSEEAEKRFSKILSHCEKKDIKICSILSRQYPKNLKPVYDAPVLLYYRGALSAADEFSIGIVGTRTPSEYGRQMCESFSAEFSKMSIPLISGMAKGIDSVCHKTSCRLENINYAILGCGVDVVYPPENKKLYEEVIECGAIVSEFPPGTFPDKINFPKRNRIISGISLGTIVIESALKGGALITAGFANDQGKEVFAVPGDLNSKQSGGTNTLIKRGNAKLVMNAEDVLVELENKMKNFVKAKNKEEKKVLPGLSKSEGVIYGLLNFEPVHIDMICEKSGFNISACLVELLSLEFKGIVRQLPGKYFVRM